MVYLRSVRWLLVTVNVVPISPIFVTLMMGGHYVPLKRPFLQESHGITSRKTAFFIQSEVFMGFLDPYRRFLGRHLLQLPCHHHPVGPCYIVYERGPLNLVRIAEELLE
jgi:hypothetical protein